MAKLGVGVGEEFPVDETAETDGSAGGPADDEARYRAWRKEREAMRAEWHARRRAFREEMRRRWHERFGDRPYEDHHHRHGRGIAVIAVVGVLAIVAVVALAHVIVPLLILALAATLAVVVLAHHHRHDHHHFDRMPPRRDTGA